MHLLPLPRAQEQQHFHVDLCQQWMPLCQMCVNRQRMTDVSTSIIPARTSVHTAWLNQIEV